MIVSFDHLALSVVDLDQEITLWQQRGYQVRFCQQAPNAPEKRSLLADYHPEHTLALLIPPAGGGITLELTCHGQHLAQPPGPYLPDPSTLNGVFLYTVDAEMESRFWSQGLGFRAREPGVLILKRPVASWSCQVTLQPVTEARNAWLDAQGHPCLALISSSLDRDLERVMQAGAHEVTPVFAVEVNQRLLRIALFRTPTGALCELIQLPQNQA